MRSARKSEKRRRVNRCINKTAVAVVASLKVLQNHFSKFFPQHTHKAYMDSMYKSMVRNVGTCEIAIMQSLYFILNGDIQRLTIKKGTFQSLRWKQIGFCLTESWVGQMRHAITIDRLFGLQYIHDYRFKTSHRSNQKRVTGGGPTWTSHPFYTGCTLRKTINYPVQKKKFLTS